MSAPGWYPDPSGQPRSYRWWDGASWTAHTTENPGYGGQQPQYGGQPPQYGPQPTGGGSGGGRKVWLIVGVIVVAVLVLVGGIVGSVLAFGGDDEPSADPIDSTATEAGTDQPSPTVSETGVPTGNPTGPLPTCPYGSPTSRESHPRDGRIHGGSLSFVRPRGFLGSDLGAGLSFGTDVGAVAREISEMRGKATWVSMYAVGAMERDDGYLGARQAAQTAIKCTVDSQFYGDATSSDTEVFSRSIVVDGHKGWYVRHEVKVDQPDIDVEGDLLDVVVVDTGDAEQYSFFEVSVPIGDTAAQAQLDRTVRGLQVD